MAIIRRHGVPKDDGQMSAGTAGETDAQADIVMDGRHSKTEAEVQGLGLEAPEAVTRHRTH